MPEIQLVITGDDSITLFVPSLNEHYHSVHGAIQEAEHVYIRAGLEFCGKESVNLLEVGFGTGLNAFLTLIKADELKKQINYTSIELYPIDKEIIPQLNYPKLVGKGFETEFQKLHEANWGEYVKISDYFYLKKLQIDLLFWQPDEIFDVIYFDAFAPNVQPDLWSESVFTKIYQSMSSEGSLTTYCSKGIVKQAMRAAGFQIERLAGPPGKWQMLRAKKSILTH
jgi:tRNA U34 5-methylaminomethyl-2-thiouridine-forming methyltransferase MnmC